MVLIFGPGNDIIYFVMRGRLIFADAATGHNDGTVSMLRAGINRVRTTGTPIPLKGTLVATIDAEASERGHHEVEVNCIDEDGNNRLPSVKMSFDVPKGGGRNNLIIAINKRVTEFGVYQFNLVVDRHEADSLVLKIEKLGEEDRNEDD